jgi:hypothetical protein
MKGGTFLYPALIKTLLLPPILAHILLRTIQPPLLFSILLYLASWPVIFIFRSYLAAWICSYKAHKLGAEDIPRVRGKSILNFDVLLDWSRSGTEEEAGRMMVLLGRKYGGTYNTRVLGEDSVSCSIEVVMLRWAPASDTDQDERIHMLMSRLSRLIRLYSVMC